ncbi:hypothetical protein HYALB_00009731 [Hymenoscyphus albidus]|uniref:Uncharacterized protein n=1 Tax=Hymenoscyphus albidus TaxID=595503 RepID=A0A9N9LHQ5_9HELO|nr:hypothetical protein HYALB_00009731 [Hymenoscyphus albidus]
MPATVTVAPHGANQFMSSNSINNPTELLKKSCFTEFKKLKDNHILQTSFDELLNENKIYSHSNGFIDGALRAHNNHHHLIIRPDDVWLSTLTQFSAYVNKHAESLRNMFVPNQGDSELFVEISGIQGAGYLGVDWEKFALLMTERISDNIKDPYLKAWILPAFTTTNETDRLVASIAMMATPQEKAERNTADLLCGLPSVTLLGEKEDWEKLMTKAERLIAVGDEPKERFELLRPVLSRFVSTFDNPTSSETTEFWRKISHYENDGSATTHLHLYREHSTKGLGLDGAQYGYIDSADIPNGWCSVPVKIDNHGVVIHSTMVAGSVGIKVTSSGKEFHEKSGQTGLDTVSPISGWWLFESKVDGELEE